MSYDFNMFLNENLGRGITYNTYNGFPMGLVSIAVYVVVSLALYTIACRREIKKPWLVWLPVVNVWTLGSLSDQYRYVVKGEIRSKRKSLLVLSIIEKLITSAEVIMILVLVVRAITGASSFVSERQMMQQIMPTVVAMLVTLIPLLGVAIARSILYYMALYDVYASCDPNNKVLYLVLSIVPAVSTIAMPLFLFLCRDKDEGMPPRRRVEPVYTQEATVYTQEPEFVHEEPPVWEAPAAEESCQNTETE